MTGRSVEFRTGYKEGGGVKKEGIIRRTLSKIRKKILPTFGEQHETATKAGKKTFTSVRKKKKGSGWTGEELGKLHYTLVYLTTVLVAVTRDLFIKSSIWHNAPILSNSFVCC